MPIYNVQRYIRECLDSLKIQTYKNLEILLVNDGSSDGSGDICEEFATIDSRFKVIHTRNNGVSAARNLGLRNATGDYVAFVDGDDKCEPFMYECLVNDAQKYKADITFCSLTFWLPNGLKKKKNPPVQNAQITKKDFIHAIFSLKKWKGCSASGGYLMNKLFRREVVKELSFINDKEYCEDEYFCVCACLNAKNIYINNRHLYLYRQRTGSLARSAAFKLKLLRGRLLINEIPDVKEFGTACPQAIVGALVNTKNVWNPSLEERDRLLILETARNFFAFAKRHCSIKNILYTWIFTLPIVFVDCVMFLKNKWNPKEQISQFYP